MNTPKQLEESTKIQLNPVKSNGVIPTGTQSLKNAEIVNYSKVGDNQVDVHVILHPISRK